MRVVWAVFIALQAVGKVASLSYDGLGAVQAAKDFAGVATTYANDIRGNATRETSGDCGAVNVEYDALGRATGLTRDATGLLTASAHSAPAGLRPKPLAAR